MLATAAPITVPTTLSWAPSAAAVIAARAPPTILVGERSSRVFWFWSVLMSSVSARAW
jgi:hypothetical protein